MRYLFRREAQARFRHQCLFLQARCMDALSTMANELSSMYSLASYQLQAMLVDADSNIALYLQQVDKYDALAGY